MKQSVRVINTELALELRLKHASSMSNNYFIETC